MTEDFLSRLTVLLIQSKEDKRKHDHDHEHCSRRQCHIRFCNKENRHTDCAAKAKQIICRLVRLNMTLVFTRLRSFGTGTNAICSLLSECDAALYFVAPHIPSIGRLTREKFNAGEIAHELNDAVTGFVWLF